MTSVGLTSSEAATRLRRYGFNELPQEKQKNIAQIALGVLREPMLLLLFVASIIYLILGEQLEAWLLVGSAVIVVGINVFEDLRSERAIEALKSLTSPRALVIRDGEQLRIPGREVVPGDHILLIEGDRVPADARVEEALNLLVDESLLTGESVPVAKHVAGGNEEHEEYASLVRSGTLVVRGSGLAVVQATGAQSEIGQIGTALTTIPESKTPLQQQTAGLVRTIGFIAVLVCGLAIVLFRLTRGGWVEASLSGIALAMGLLPEEFPLILSLFLALGGRRLSRRGILIRRMAAVETLGTVTTLAVDKTGTLTRNEMSLMEVVLPSGSRFPIRQATEAPQQSNERLALLLRTAKLSTRAASFDPMDRAIHSALKDIPTAETDTKFLQEFPLSSDLPASGLAWAEHDGFQLAIKGAPEALLQLAGADDALRAQVSEQLELLARRGFRVLGVGVAHAAEIKPTLAEHRVTFLGLLAFADPLRDGIGQAVNQCYSAGMRVVMITGDYPTTAAVIAAEAGIKNPERVITGAEMSTMNSLELAGIARSVNIFARVSPSQKLQLVEMLKESGEIVAMTGDGVNDAPALKMAHVGVAMGGRGTDVAREASSVVLTHDDFGSLVEAVRLGRKTYDNIKKSMYYIVAVHIPIAGLALLPLVLGLPVILFPIHIVLLELIIDPVSSIVFEAEAPEQNVMLRPPRDTRAPIFQARNLLLAAMQGVSILIACTAIYLIAYDNTHSEFEARTLSFSTLVLANLGLAIVNRSWSRTFLAMLRVPNPSMWYGLAGGLALLIAITQFGPVSRLFHFGPYHLHDLLFCIGAAILSLAWFEILKYFVRGKLVL